MTIELGVSFRASATARAMEQAARRFLDSLRPDQVPFAHFTFEGDERYFWHYTPVQRGGLMYRYMIPVQREAAMGLLDTGVSGRGAEQVRQIMALEPILREHEAVERMDMPWTRDEEMYWWSVFGEPGGSNPWGWRVGGHHIGLHFTIVDRELISPLPLFFGANPTQVRYGPHLGRRTLAEEEDMARDLVRSLPADQKAIAIVDPVAPDDILTKNYRRADPTSLPVGLAFSAMSGEHREKLVRLIRHYVTRASDELASNEWAKIEREGLDAVTFAWAGPEVRARGNGHYYAVKGPTFLIEYDNTQNEANHIHSVFRDYTNDWGEDLLADHYARDHRR